MGVALTSFFFGAFHILPNQGMMAAVLGVALHYAYVTTRSLVSPMLLHFLNNGLAVVGLFFAPELEKIDTDPAGISPWLYAASALLLAAVGWALYRTRARLYTPPDSVLPPWQPDFPGVALPPPGTGTVVTHPWPGLLTVVLVAFAAAAFAVAFTLEVLGLLPKWPSLPAVGLVLAAVTTFAVLVTLDAVGVLSGRR